MKNLTPSQQQRILQELVSTPDREARFARIEDEYVDRLRAGSTAGPAGRRTSMIIAAGVTLLVVTALLTVLLTSDWSTPSAIDQPQQHLILEPAPTSNADVPTERATERATEKATERATAETVSKNPDNKSTVPAERPAPVTSPDGSLPVAPPSTAVISTTASESVASQAQRAADSLLAVLRTTKDPIQRAPLLYSVAMRLKAAGNTAGALAYLQDAATTARSLSAVKLEARATFQRGLLLIQRGQREEGRRLCRAAIALLPESDAQLRDQWTRQLQLQP